MGMSLYEIDSQIKGIIDKIYSADDFDGEITEADFDELRQLKEDRQVKLENIGLYIKNLEAEAAAIKAEEENLYKRRKRAENKAEGLRNLLINSLIENGENEFSTTRIRAKIRNSEKTEIVDLDSIPEEFVEVKTTKQPDKKKIKEAIKAGIEVSGAQIVTNQTVRIE